MHANPEVHSTSSMSHCWPCFVQIAVSVVISIMIKYLQHNFLCNLRDYFKFMNDLPPRINSERDEKIEVEQLRVVK